jgi:hypothetical protein
LGLSPDVAVTIGNSVPVRLTLDYCGMPSL